MGDNLCLYGGESESEDAVWDQPRLHSGTLSKAQQKENLTQNKMETKMNQLINQLAAKQLIKQNNAETIERHWKHII